MKHTLQIQTGQPIRLGCVYDASALGAFTVRLKKSEANTVGGVLASVHFGYFDTRCPKIGGGFSVRGDRGFISASESRIVTELSPEQIAKLEIASGWKVQMHNQK